VKAKPIEAIATCDGFRKGSTHPTTSNADAPRAILRPDVGISVVA